MVSSSWGRYAFKPSVVEPFRPAFAPKKRALADSERHPRDETCATHSPPACTSVGHPGNPPGAAHARQQQSLRGGLAAAPGRALGEAANSPLLFVPRKGGGDVVGFPAFCMRRGGAAGLYHLEEPPPQVFRRRLPGRRGGRRPPLRVGTVQPAPGHTWTHASKGRSKVLMT